MRGETQSYIMVEGGRLPRNLDSFSVIPCIVLFTHDFNYFHGVVVATVGEVFFNSKQD